MKKDSSTRRFEINKRKLIVMPVIPQSITLCGQVIKTVFEENLLADREIYGEFRQREMVIALDKSLPPQKAKVTYCHELSEAMESIFVLDLKEPEKQAFALTLYELLMQGKLYTIIEEE